MEEIKHVPKTRRTAVPARKGVVGYRLLTPAVVQATVSPTRCTSYLKVRKDATDVRLGERELRLAHGLPEVSCANAAAASCRSKVGGCPSQPLG